MSGAVCSLQSVEAPAHPLGAYAPEGKGIRLRVARGETLVGRVEEYVVRALFERRADLTPLLRGGVDPCRIVGTRVEEEDGTAGRLLDVTHHAFEV